jgi:hypothetical protein
LSESAFFIDQIVSSQSVEVSLCGHPRGRARRPTPTTDIEKAPARLTITSIDHNENLRNNPLLFIRPSILPMSVGVVSFNGTTINL